MPLGRSLPQPLQSLSTCIQQKSPAGSQPIRQVGISPLKPPFAGEGKMGPPVPILFGIFIAPWGRSAAVEAIDRKQANTSVPVSLPPFKLVKKLI